MYLIFLGSHNKIAVFHLFSYSKWGVSTHDLSLVPQTIACVESTTRIDLVAWQDQDFSGYQEHVPSWSLKPVTTVLPFPHRYWACLAVNFRRIKQPRLALFPALGLAQS